MLGSGATFGYDYTLPGSLIMASANVAKDSSCQLAAPSEPIPHHNKPLRHSLVGKPISCHAKNTTTHHEAHKGKGVPCTNRKGKITKDG